MQYNVLSDFHHASLLNSLIMLFEDRLGGRLYRPIGREWWEQGYWKVYDHPATVEQYLGIGGATPDGTEPLNTIVGEGARIGSDGKRMPVYHCHDIDSHKTNKGITLEGFFNTKIDFLVASIPAHLNPYFKLAQTHPNHPKLIYQIGNAWPQTPDIALADGIMASAKIDWGEGRKFYKTPFIEYHQEFDLHDFYPAITRMPDDPKYHYERSVMPDQNVFTFVNCFSVDGMFGNDWALFQKIESMMPGWQFKAYGGQCRDGCAHGSRELATAMRSSRFVWHTKRGGDGYGHVIHNTAAVARPTLVKREYYWGKMAEDLLIDGETCIAIDNLRPDEIVNKINYYSDPARYAAMSRAVYANFRRVIDFDVEADKLANWLEGLVK